MDVYNDLDATLIDDYLLSDDIWKQFQIEEMQMQVLPVIDAMTCSMLCERNCQVKYDCMWNGHCKGAHGNRSCNSKSAFTPGDVRAPAVQVASSQQSLLKPDLKITVDPNTVVPMMPTLYNSIQIQTPPISDDEETKPTQILQSLVSAISENELDDADLSDYFKGGDRDWGFFDEQLEQEEDEEELMMQKKKQEIDMRAFYAATDHSYHKGTYVTRSGNLGIDTPSDSEEEIDVVSLGDKFSSKAAAAGALPNNPSTKDKRQLQRTMKNRFPPRGLKTLMPVKKATQSQAKKTEGRPKGRQCKPKQNQTQKQNQKQNQKQYKKKSVYGEDDDHEPSEKRHLHNDMERQRRIDLRNLFMDLKKLVPVVAKKQRAAKVTILREASQYCEDLQYTHYNLGKRVQLLKRTQARYRAHLSKLRRACAAKR